MKLAFLPSLGHNSSTPLMGTRFMDFFEAKEYYQLSIQFMKRRTEDKPVALLIVVVELGSIRLFTGIPA